MQPIDFLILTIYFAIEQFAHVSLGYFWLALALFLGRMLTGGTITFVVARKTAG